MVNKKKIIDILSIITLFIGFFLAFLPHALHASVRLGNKASHLMHVLVGIILVVIALCVLIHSNKMYARF